MIYKWQKSCFGKHEGKYVRHIQRKQYENLWDLKASNKLAKKIMELPNTAQNMAISV
jgi:hypothetical protein